MNTASGRLVVHALPGDHGQNLAKALADIATGGPAGLVSLDEAALHLARDPAHRLCILYVDPVRVICAAMADNQDLERAVEAWTAQARAALGLHRRNRRRSMIFEAGHLQRYAATALDRLDIETDSRALGTITDTAQPPTPLNYILARSLLNEMTEAKTAAEELNASTQILSNEEGLTSETLALEAYQDLQDKIGDAAHLPALRAEISDLKTALTVLKAEHDAALAQARDKTHALETVQSQLEAQAADKKAIAAARDALTADKAEMQAQAAALREEIDAKSAQIANLEIQRAATTAEMEALGTKLGVLTDQAGRNSKAREQMELEMASQRHAQKTILDTTYNKLEQTTAALSEREAALADAQAHIEHIMNSRSMRLTRPLRAAFSFLRGSR